MLRSFSVQFSIAIGASISSFVFANRYISPLVAANRGAIPDLGPDPLGAHAPLGEIVPIGEAVGVDIDLGLAASDAGVRLQRLLRARHRLLLEAEHAGPVPDLAEPVAGFAVLRVQLGVGVGGVFHAVRRVIVHHAAAEDSAAPGGGNGRAEAEEEQRESCGLNEKGEEGAGHFFGIGGGLE